MIAVRENGPDPVTVSRRCAMRRYNPWAVTVVSMVFVGVAAAATLDGAVALLSKEEAESLAAQSPAGLVDVAAGLDDGPKIEMILPAEQEPVRSPFPLHIRFTPVNGREVELRHLKVELVKVLSFDITHRIQPYVFKGGIRIERVALPQGEFRFKVSLGDVAGGISVKLFPVKVL